MQLRDEESGQVVQLDAIGPMSENCEGPITFPPGRHLDAITASYTLLGVSVLGYSRLFRVPLKSLA